MTHQQPIRGSVSEHDQGVGLDMAMKTPFSPGENNIFKQKFEIIPT